MNQLAGHAPPFQKMLDALDTNHMFSVHWNSRWQVTQPSTEPMEGKLPAPAVLEMANLTAG